MFLEDIQSIKAKDHITSNAENFPQMFKMFKLSRKINK